jgi:hypothetical protein
VFVKLGLMGAKSQLCKASTEIVIEGAPRSGNSFAVQAFRFANPDVNEIATHLHAPANVLLGISMKKPTMVVIRNPLEVVCSMRALSIEVSVRENIKNPNVGTSFRQLLLDYTQFYSALHSVKNDCLFASFDTITRNFGKAIDALNDRFGTDFTPFLHSAENLDTIRNSAGYHALPNEVRGRIAKDVKRDFEAETCLDSEIQKSLEIYETFKAYAV